MRIVVAGLGVQGRKRRAVAGDQVVVSNTALLRTGMPVKLAGGAAQPGVN